jgi:hypothetical protein
MLQIDCFHAASLKTRRVLLQIIRKELDSQDCKMHFSDSKGCNSRHTSMVGVFFVWWWQRVCDFGEGCIPQEVASTFV